MSELKDMRNVWRAQRELEKVIETIKTLRVNLGEIEQAAVCAAKALACEAEKGLYDT